MSNKNIFDWIEGVAIVVLLIILLITNPFPG